MIKKNDWRKSWRNDRGNDEEKGWRRDAVGKGWREIMQKRLGEMKEEKVDGTMRGRRMNDWRK